MQTKRTVAIMHFYTVKHLSAVLTLFQRHTFVACKTLTAQSLQLQALVGLCVIVAVSAYANFADSIPNSANVVNPCDLDGVRGQPWPGIGHRQSVGSGPRNQFGIDWARNNFVRY